VVVEVPALRECKRGDEQRRGERPAERHERDQPDEILGREHLRERERAGNRSRERHAELASARERDPHGGEREYRRGRGGDAERVRQVAREVARGRGM